jgi:NAD(P)H-dependent flavin oxidoreductase YrpB (nitropropane dioxygenase family)
MIATRFTALVGVTAPIQVAPMGLITSPALIAAATEAGAHAGFGATMLPAPALAAQLDAVEARVGRGFLVNFLVPFVDPACVDLAARRAAMVDFFHGPPDRALVARVHAAGARCAWQVLSAAEAVAAREAGCDLIIAHGREAGGRNPAGIGLIALLQQVLDAVPDLPVLAAGGIATGRGVAPAIAAGADGVRIGTRFLLAEEADVHPRYVEALLAAAGEDTVLTDAFSAGWAGGATAEARVLRSCLDAARRLDAEVAGHLALGPVELPIPRFAPPPPMRATRGAIDAMALYAGEAVGLANRVEPAAAIVRALVAGAERCLRDAAARLG